MMKPSEVVEFSEQVHRALGVLAPVVAKRVKANEIDEDGDRVLVITTAIALIQSGVSLHAAGMYSANKDKAEVIDATLEFTLKIMRETIEQTLDVEIEMQTHLVETKDDVKH